MITRETMNRTEITYLLALIKVELGACNHLDKLIAELYINATKVDELRDKIEDARNILTHYKLRKEK